jgi:hypothetical protein
MRRTVIGALPQLRADQLADLGLHQLLGDSPHRLADHVGVFIAQHLTNDLGNRHPVLTGHRRPPFVRPSAVRRS